MVGKRQKRKRSAKLLGSHQRCWLWGRHAVLETLRAGRWLPLQVSYAEGSLAPDVLSELQLHCRLLSCPLVASSPVDLARLCGSREHQGLMAQMPPYPYCDPAAVLGKIGPHSLVLVLCGIQDPFNFGSILRSADLFDVDFVVIPEAGQADVSAHVARSSVGAVNFLDIVRVASLAQICLELKTAGLQLVAASEKGVQAPAEVTLRAGIALVIGNEGAGIEAAVLSLCDHQLRIPTGGHVGSLNAAVAAGILCYEVRRQQHTAAAY